MKLLIVLLFSFIFAQQAFAQEYILPYPGQMPGSKFYILSQIKEKIDEFLYFGDFSQYRLYRELSDKYLVEAKTLFEYKQYLLAVNALKKSNDYFNKSEKSLENARLEGKNISQKRAELDLARIKHVEVLKKIRGEIPQEFNWTPEKDDTTYIMLWDEVDGSINVRK